MLSKMAAKNYGINSINILCVLSNSLTMQSLFRDSIIQVHFIETKRKGSYYTENE